METKVLVPLPAEWNSPANVPAVTLWGMNVSGPSCKVKIILEYYGIKHTVIKTDKKKNDPYRYVPILMIGDIQINDSFNIV